MKKNIGTTLLKHEGKFYIRTRDRNIYEINEVGARIYDLANGNSKEDIHKKLSSIYEVSPERLLKEIEEFSRELINLGILEE